MLSIKNGAPGEIRTPNLRFRRPQLYPVELRRRYYGGPLGLEPIQKIWTLSTQNPLLFGPITCLGEGSWQSL